MIRLPRPRFPRGFLTRQHGPQAIQIGDHAAIDVFVKGKQPRLVTEELADGDRLLALLREFRPVPADRRFVIKPAAGMGEGHRHRGEPLGGGPDEDHGVLLPQLARPLVPNASPEVDHFLGAGSGR